MYFFLFSFNYLALRNAKGNLILWRDVPSVAFGSLTGLLIFSLINGSNFFGHDGFVDKVGSVTASITGFYIAGLLAVATFASENSALDAKIKIGPVYRNKTDLKSNRGMNRREYVCSIFGYLAFVSLIISIFSALISGLSPGISNYFAGTTYSISGYLINLFDFFLDYQN